MDLVNNENLTPKQMRRVIYALAFPIVGTNLLLRGVGIVDTAMVGHISPQVQAAVGMSQWIIGLMMALLWGVAMGNLLRGVPIEPSRWPILPERGTKKTEFHPLIRFSGWGSGHRL